MYPRSDCKYVRDDACSLKGCDWRHTRQHSPGGDNSRVRDGSQSREFNFISRCCRPRHAHTGVSQNRKNICTARSSCDASSTPPQSIKYARRVGNKRPSKMCYEWMIIDGWGNICGNWHVNTSNRLKTMETRTHVWYGLIQYSVGIRETGKRRIRLDIVWKTLKFE